MSSGLANLPNLPKMPNMHNIRQKENSRIQNKPNIEVKFTEIKLKHKLELNKCKTSKV